MKYILLAAAAALVLTACGDATSKMADKTADVSATPAAAGSMMDKATAMVPVKTKAVLVYADWCASCKVLDPALNKAKAMGKLPGVEFVVLDYTDKNDENFYAQAEAAGVEAAVRAHLDGTVKTGQLLLVDFDDEVVVGTVTQDNAAPQILAKIKDALAKS